MSYRSRILCLFDSIPNLGLVTGFSPATLASLAYVGSPEIITGALFRSDNPDVDDSHEDSITQLGLTQRGIWWNPAARRSIARLIRHVNPDCVIANGIYSRILGLGAAARLGISPLVAVVDGMGLDIRHADLLSLQRIDRVTDRLVTTSYAGARRLVHQERVDRARIEIIPNGIDASQFPQRTPETIAEAKHAMGLSVEQPVILMAADFKRDSDHHTFLEAAEHLASVQHDSRFVVLGYATKSAYKEWNAALDETGLRGRFVDSTDQSLYRHWLAAADVGVLTGYGESCSPTLLTYMAAGLPIVTSNAAGNPELLRHGESGYLAVLKEADQWAMFMTVCLLSPELCERLGQAARRRAQYEFSADRARKRWEDFLNTLTISTHA